MAKQYQHIPGTIYLVTFTYVEGRNWSTFNDPFMDETIEMVIEHVQEAKDHVIDCKIRAIHDEDGTVRDVTEDIAQIMAERERFWDGHRPDWVDYPSFKLNIYSLWFRDQPELEE